MALNSKNNKYKFNIEKVKGGKANEIQLLSIELELQKKYITEYFENLTFTNNIVQLHNFKLALEKTITSKQRKLAFVRLHNLNMIN